MTNQGKYNEEGICKLTGSILRPSQPFPLWVSLNTNDIKAVSLLKSKVCFTASAVHTCLPLVNCLQRAYQLIYAVVQKRIYANTHKGRKLNRLLQLFLQWSFMCLHVHMLYIFLKELIEIYLPFPTLSTHFEFLSGLLFFLLSLLLLLLLSLQAFFLLLVIFLFLLFLFLFSRFP